jgi:hypothetical protein
MMSKIEKYLCLAMCYTELAMYNFFLWLYRVLPGKRLPVVHMWEDMRLIVLSYIEEFKEC